jgi:hypothetical protein
VTKRSRGRFPEGRFPAGRVPDPDESYDKWGVILACLHWQKGWTGGTDWTYWDRD